MLFAPGIPRLCDFHHTFNVFLLFFLFLLIPRRGKVNDCVIVCDSCVYNMSFLHPVCLLSVLFSIDFHHHRTRSTPLLLLSTIHVQFINFVHDLQTFPALLGYKGGKSGHQRLFLFTICRQIYKIQNTETSRSAFTKCVFLWSYELQNTKCTPWNACVNAPFCVCCMIVIAVVLFMIHIQTRLYCPYFMYIFA